MVNRISDITLKKLLLCIGLFFLLCIQNTYAQKRTDHTNHPKEHNKDVKSYKSNKKKNRTKKSNSNSYQQRGNTKKQREAVIHQDKKGSGNKKKAKATPQSSNNSTYKIEGKRNYHTESSGKHNKKVNKEHKQDRQAKEKKQKQYQRNMEAPIEPSQRNNGKSTSNNHLEVQKTRKGVRNAEKVEPEIKFSNDARKQVSKDMKKFEPYVNVDPTNKYKAVNKHKNNPLEIRVPKDKDKYIQKDFSESKGYYIEVEKQKGRKVTRDAAKHKGVYVTVEKKPGRQVGRDAATYKGGYVVVEKNKGRKVSREAANYKGYVVIDRSRNRKIARQAANFEPNYVKVKQKLALTRMTYGKGHGKNAGKQVQKQRFAPHFKTIHNSTIKGKSNSMKKKPLKYTYDKGEVEIWN